MKHAAWLNIFALLALSMGSAGAAAHPLDPLSWREHWTVLEVLQKAGKIDSATRFTRIALRNPDKASVWSWQPEARLPRQAEAVIKQGNTVFEAVVDLDAAKLSSWIERKGVQAPWLTEEYFAPVVYEVLQNPEFLARLKTRGVESASFVQCFAYSPGNLDDARYRGRRVAKIGCHPLGPYRNIWPRRIEGLIVLVDVATNEILEISDDEVVPVPPGGRDYDLAALGKLREFAAPIEVRQPLGPGFAIEGHLVKWDQWRFHIRPDARVGTILSTVTWQDGERSRPVLYEGHLSEIFVPYMDPRRDWYTRTFIDAGEYAAGGLADTLTPGIDCPENAVYVNGIVAQDNGWPKDKPRVACLFERYGGDMSWRHATDGRPQRELVVRMILMVGNYDYVVDWRLQTDGQIRVAVGATGIVETKMVRDRDAAGSGKATEPADAYGRFVDDYVVAVNHDHYFNFRLDLDVDGRANRFVRDMLVPRQLPADHPRRSVWVMQSMQAMREQDAQLDAQMHAPALWRVLNVKQTNRMGYPTSYQLVPGHSDHTLMSPDDRAAGRAGFINHRLWVTPYADDERYAAGAYPLQSEPGQGLPLWTSANRSIDSTDLVLWYTIGMHHVVRGEEWPVMPVLWHDFTLRPFDFHSTNPALDIGLRP